MSVGRGIQPIESGTVERAGVVLAWQVFGSEERTVVLMPPWNLQDSRVWKLTIGCLVQKFRIVTFDPPGNGSSTPSADPERYLPEAQASDAIAVMDATGTERAVVVAHSRAAQGLLSMAADFPERVAGAVFLGPLAPWTRTVFPRLLTHPALRWALEVPAPRPVGWRHLSAPLIRRDLRRFADWFIRRALTVPHSEWGIDEAIDHALEADPESVIAAMKAPIVHRRAHLAALAGRVKVPTVVVHGDADQLIPLADGRWLADATGGELVVLPGGDHCPHGRRVQRTANSISSLADQVLGRGAASAVTALRDPGRPRVLVVCSPIGLGHARRDLAIVQALRRMRPDVDVEWLAQHPVTTVLEAAGETIHPASAQLLSECRHFELESVGHQLDIFGAFRSGQDLMAHNFSVFREVLREGEYAAVLGDEAWEVDQFLHEHPEEKRAPYVWLTDFVGVLPTAETDPRTAELIADVNALMVDQVRSHAVRDLSLFIGNPEDALDVPLGPGLPTVRAWAEEEFRFTGYVGARRHDEDSRALARKSLGVGPDQPLCVVAVGGSGVGDELLRRAVSAHEVARRSIDDLWTVVVTGPRIRLDGVAAAGLDVRGYIPDLDRLLAGADMALVQGGLATAMELTANETPFAYVPLDRHFEQQLHVPHRLANYGSGRRISFADADPDNLAQAVTDGLVTTASWRDVEQGGHDEAARLIEALL
jgi:pimeloyl-ACP methyl ester carboxylesterase/predicted glycosyltransferase